MLHISSQQTGFIPIHNTQLIKRPYAYSTSPGDRLVLLGRVRLVTLTLPSSSISPSSSSKVRWVYWFNFLFSISSSTFACSTCCCPEAE
ncbi:hypothetical protein DPMN_126134 [Dreissena polymorpha]|uniref:Uncharacterized protein n=1 Tax=Dreissena polymorpha TaxID=45954 RepID=A0A9D4JTN7_DREPO|nr:hypothetical protein DPMN_126134 [Dreissena polymorpha]